MIVEMVGAYVEGLPIPNSSNFFTRLASEYRGGFWVNLSVAVICFAARFSPAVTLGRSAPLSSSFSSSVPSMYTFRNPSKRRTSPMASNRSCFWDTPIVIVVFSSAASAIWQAIVLFQISS